jgi:hypothetical protein
MHGYKSAAARNAQVVPDARHGAFDEYITTQPGKHAIGGERNLAIAKPREIAEEDRIGDESQRSGNRVGRGRVSFDGDAWALRVVAVQQPAAGIDAEDRHAATCSEWSVKSDPQPWFAVCEGFA